MGTGLVPLYMRIRLEVGDSSVSPLPLPVPFPYDFVIRGHFLMGRKMICSKQAILMAVCFPGSGEVVK